MVGSPRHDPQTSGGAAEAASRRPGGRGGSAFDEEGGAHSYKEIRATGGHTATGVPAEVLGPVLVRTYYVVCMRAELTYGTVWMR